MLPYTYGPEDVRIIKRLYMRKHRDPNTKILLEIFIDLILSLKNVICKKYQKTISNEGLAKNVLSWKKLFYFHSMKRSFRIKDHLEFFF